jgi:serine/threonine protein kinase/tetratricopeptide (TPR) repeat protein
MMIGKTISHYKILEKLGEGGMGVVYKAFDTKLEREVALKVLRPEVMGDPVAKKRFIREARAASALNHPNITTIHEIDNWHGLDFICMEYVEGETVKKKIQSGQISMDEVLNIATQTAEALQEAHEHDITHRDIKSENIMVTPKGQVKVMDFGLAKLKGQKTLTKAGVKMGTVSYMSPEQARGEDVDHRTDIWSFGVVLYEMITGRAPFRGDHELAVIYLILNEESKPITELRSGVPIELERIVDKALEKNKEDRLQSANEMLVDLKRLRRDTDKVIEGVSVSEFKKRRDQRQFKAPRKSLWIGLGAIALVIIALVLILKQGILKRGITPSKIKANSIAVMYFDNHTDEPNLEKIFVDMLTTNLSRYEELEVLSSQRLFDIFKLIGEDKIETMDKHIATEVANRAQVKTMLLGSIIKFGNRIRINTQLCDVQTGSNIGSEQVEGSKLEDIFTMADSLTARVRVRLEVSVPGVGEQPLKIADVTTNSYQAYKYFIQGREASEKRYFQDAREFLENAIALDSTFAIAYLSLSRVNIQLERYEESYKEISQAKLFTDKATEKERLLIEAYYTSQIERDSDKYFNLLIKITKKYPNEKLGHHDLAYYYRAVAQQFDKAIEECNKVLELDPNYGSALSNLGYIYAEMGDFKKSIYHFKRYASIFPEDANPFDSMAEVYFKMGLLDKALETYKRASAIKPGFSDWQLSYIYALKEDYPSAMEWIDLYIANEASKSRQAGGYWWRGLYHYLLGRYELTEHDLILTKVVAETGDSDFWLIAIDWLKGWIYYDRDEFELSKKHFKSWTDHAKWHPEAFQSWWLFLQGLVDVKQGKISSAKAKQADMKILTSEVNEWKEVEIYYNELLLAEILIAEGTPEKVAHIGMKDTLKVIGRLYSTFIPPINVPFMKDVWARAYYQAGDLDRAIAEYERLITFNPKSKDRRLINPKYHYLLAKLYEEKGWSDKAIKEYEKFLDIWKDADESLLEFIDAKQRLAKLKADG